MNKLKDFIYDKNDIIIAAAILVAAALLIWWRLNVILDYPQQLISDSTDTSVTEITDSGDATDASSVDTTDTGDGTTDGNSDATTTELWADGALTKDVEVTVDGETASAAIQCLVDAGLFTDYAEYQSACDSLGLDDEKVSAGTFTFAQGSTKEQVARQVNWG